MNKAELKQRLYQQAGQVHFGLKPVPGTSLDSLDHRRLRDYFVRVLGGEAPPQEDIEQWRNLLHNLDLTTVREGGVSATVDGILLFGWNPRRYLPQSGIRAICYLGPDPDYATRTDEDLRGPLVPLRAHDGTLVEPGLADQAWDFVRRNTTPSAYLEGFRRVDRWEYPELVVREAVGNALVHRDYSIAGTDIMLHRFTVRLWKDG